MKLLLTVTYFLLSHTSYPFFMGLRRRATSGTISTCIQTLFLLSAKIQILLTSAEQTGGFKLTVRASTRAAFEVAKMGLDKSESFYRGMILWAGQREEMSDDTRAAIIEPAQVLVLMEARRCAEEYPRAQRPRRIK